MFKIIFYLIITIFILHFTLYYFNFDFDITTFNYFEKNKDKSNNIDNINIQAITNTIELNESLNESINELKTLNECINNGQINTSFS